MVQPAIAGSHRDDGGQQEGHAVIAGLDRLEALARLPAAERPPLDSACRGVLAETALSGRQRYEWRLLLPLLHTLLDSVLRDYTQEQQEEVGPPRPLPAGVDSPAALALRLHALLDGHAAAPFTLQRLCEVLLEPRKQYLRLDKVAPAIEKLLIVTSTRLPDPPERLPPPPTLSSLAGVNSNPPSPYLDGRPPQVLDQQQHQAFLHQQQQHGGLPNGLDDRPQGAAGAPEHGATAGGAAEAPAEAMQVDGQAAPAAAEGQSAGAVPDETPPAITAAEAASAARFVESALADLLEGDGVTAAGSLQPQSDVGMPAQRHAQAATEASGPAAVGQDGMTALRAAAPTSADIELAANDAQLQAGRQAQQGPIQPPSSAAASSLARIIASLQHHLPQALQAVVLPPLVEKQQQLSASQARPHSTDEPAVGSLDSVPAGDQALDQLLGLALTQLSQDTAAAVLGRLQPLLPLQTLQHLQQRYLH